MTIRHNRGQSVHVHRRNNNQETIPLADDRLMSKYVDSCLVRVCAAGGTRDASLILSIALAATVTRIQILSLVLLNIFFFFRFFSGSTKENLSWGLLQHGILLVGCPSCCPNNGIKALQKQICDLPNTFTTKYVFS